MLALADVSKLIPSLLVCLRHLAIIQPHPQTDQALLAKIKGAIHVVIAEDAAFNDPSRRGARERARPAWR